MQTNLFKFSRRTALLAVVFSAVFASFGLGSYTAAASSAEDTLPPIAAAYFSCF